MERHLNLVESGNEIVEKRILPRFPFAYLVFKENKSTYEVGDISYTGMQLIMKNGDVNYKKGDKIKGIIHWCSASLKIVGTVQWVNGNRLGIAFNESRGFEKEIKNFLSIENIIAGMKPLHRMPIGVEIPSDLKYWLRADGPVELFVWQHKDGELSRFQMILLNNFVEWEDGQGLTSGRVIGRRDVDTPLYSEDEFEFQIETSIDSEKISFARQVVSKIPDDFLSVQTREFIEVKLSR